MINIPPFPTKKYSIIYADPPWSYRDKAAAGRRGAGFKYSTMNLEEIYNVRVRQVAADDAFLFLWVTAPMLPYCFQVFSRWGFQYKTVAFTWIKYNKKNPTLFWGMGNWTRANAEYCLIGTRGRPKRQSARVHSVVQSAIEEHSKKPDVVRERIVELCGDLPRIELFARQQVEGWDAWGLEI